MCTFQKHVKIRLSCRKHNNCSKNISLSNPEFSEQHGIKIDFIL